MKKLALVGIGKWGKILLKEFNDISVVKLCYSTGDNQNIKWLKKNYPKIKEIKDEKPDLIISIGLSILSKPLKKESNTSINSPGCIFSVFFVNPTKSQNKIVEEE